MSTQNDNATDTTRDAERVREAFGRDAHRFHVGWRYHDAPDHARNPQAMDLFRACDAIAGCSAIAALLRANDSARSEGAQVLTDPHASGLQDGLHALLDYVSDYLETAYEKAVGRGQQDRARSPAS